MQEGKSLAERRAALAPEVYLMPTSHCSGGCRYCYLDKGRVALKRDLHWKNFFRNAFKVLSSLDFSKRGAICITGGELLSDELLKDKDYEINLKKLFKVVDSLIGDTHYRLAVPVGLENIGELGRTFIRWIREEISYAQILCSYTSEKLRNKEKISIYNKNVELLKDYISAFMCIMVNKDDYYLVQKSGLLERFVVNFDEPVMVNRSLAYSYGEVDWFLTYKFHSPHCSSNKDIIVTPSGFFTCGQISVKPDWVSFEEWNRFCNDKKFLEEGYQEVMDWYGCNKCEKNQECPGMCWISYYAQRYLFNNRKCIYRRHQP